MAFRDVSWSKAKPFEISGVHYDITTQAFGSDMFRAVWSCSACDEVGAWAPISAKASQAVEMAKVGVRIHHAFLHQGGTAPRRPR
jgi:hypothetical protein